MIRRLLTILFTLRLFLSAEFAQARPEYAALTKLNCIQCHVLPWGGGPRTVFGKNYGAHGHTPSPLSQSDIYYGDVRFIDYLPNHPASNTNGLALMQASVTGNVPIVKGEANTEMRGVLTYNMAPLSGSTVREAYVRWSLAHELKDTPFTIVFGRVYMPFGLLIDEHRTYTRIQTNMTYNNFNLGCVLSGNFKVPFHFDLAVVNDFQTGGTFTRNDLTFGIVLNFRWNPTQLPFLLGASGNYQKIINQPQPLASSLYGVLSLNLLTKNKINGSLSFERVDAINWNNPAVNTGMLNPPLVTFFIPTSDSAYQQYVVNKSSVGYFGLAKFFITQPFLIFYKLDYLALDRYTLNDAYWRHGIGFEWYPNSNLILNVRYEKTAGMRPEIVGSPALAAQDDIFAMLRVWI